MKIKLLSFVSLIAIAGMGFMMQSFTSNNNHVATVAAIDVDCDKCNNPKCDGKCDTKNGKCTDECKKDGKCSHTKADHKCTDECKKENKCSHSTDTKKAATTTAKSCCSKGAKNEKCSPKKECGKHK